MKFLKGLMLSLLSLLLFFSLSLFGLTYMLNRTLMEPGFVSAELEKLDIAQFFREIVGPQVSQGQQASIDPVLINEAMFAAIAKSEPQLKEAAKTAIYSGYDYFLGKSEQLNITISLEPVKTSLKDTLWQEFQKSPPQQFVGLPPATAEQVYNQFYQELSRQLPSSWEIKESELSPQTLGLLYEIRRYLGYYQILPNVLIGLIVLSVLGIILIGRNIKGTTRSLGINLLFYGGIGYAIDFLFDRFGSPYLTVPGLPPSIQPWITKVMEDIVAPLEFFSIVILAAGALLFVISFLIRQQRAET